MPVLYKTRPSVAVGSKSNLVNQWREVQQNYECLDMGPSSHGADKDSQFLPAKYIVPPAQISHQNVVHHCPLCTDLMIRNTKCHRERIQPKGHPISVAWPLNTTDWKPGIMSQACCAAMMAL